MIEIDSLLDATRNPRFVDADMAGAIEQLSSDDGVSKARPITLAESANGPEP